MIKLNENTKYEVQDRMKISVVTSAAPFEYAGEKNIGKFFVSLSGEFESNGVNASGRMVGYTNHKCSITGRSVVIEIPGMNINGTRISELNVLTEGDLSYIDGCSNSNIVPPLRNGDPCLNYLYFPHGTEQTFHHHPSVRVITVVGGSGFADYYKMGQTFRALLDTGDVFVLPRFMKHRFTTRAGMSVVAFHPDSEDGPTDERNPMKARTYVTD